MFFLLLACGEEGTIDTASSEPSSEDADIVTYNPTAQVEWGEENLMLHLSNTTGYDFYFGIVESTEECKQNVEFGCWTGENCSSTDPYKSSDESINLGPYCHPTDGDGIALALNYSTSFTSVFQGTDVVSNGTQTAFPAPYIANDTGEDDVSYEFQVTYYLEDKISGKCWAWGIDPSYFKDRNCNLPVPTSGWTSKGNAVILQ